MKKTYTRSSYLSKNLKKICGVSIYKYIYVCMLELEVVEREEGFGKN